MKEIDEATLAAYALLVGKALAVHKDQKACWILIRAAAHITHGAILPQGYFFPHSAALN